MASRTASRVSGRTAGWSLSTRETVCLETPDSRATSAITGRVPAKLRLLRPLGTGPSVALGVMAGDSSTSDTAVLNPPGRSTA